MAILNNSNAISSGGYDINNSLRFRSSASAFLSRTPASASNQQIWTWSAWVKRANLGAQGMLFAPFTGGDGSNENVFRFETTDKIRIYDSGTTRGDLNSSRVFRDPSAWYHIVLSVDLTQATSTNRVRLYVNNELETLTGTYPAQNTTWGWNNTSIHYIGSYRGSLAFLDGYLTEINFIDGQSLTPSSFGETDTTTGSWKPKAYTSTYGTNGFYQKYSDIATTSGSNAGLGKDFSGNGNYYNTNNISVTAGITYDAMIDSPTLTSATVANYPVANPINAATGLTISDGNLKLTASTSGSKFVNSSLALPSSGAFYGEITFGNASTSSIGQNIGVALASRSLTAANNAAGAYLFYASTSGTLISNGTQTAGSLSAISANEVFQVAIDVTNSKMWIGRSNVWYNSTGGTTGNPSTGANPTFTAAFADYFIYAGFDTTSSVSANFNFGQRPFTYTPPTGFVRLNTFNLPDSTIKKGSSYMDATLYTGNGSAQTIVNAAGFRPDLVWQKPRSEVASHRLVDSVRGVNKTINSNQTDAEATETNTLTSFNSNGFTGGGSNAVTSGNTAVAWQWQAGQGTNTSNTSGTITSTVSVNATAGFSIATYTGNGSTGATFGHGLNVAPKMVIIKKRSTGTAGNWIVYHTSTGINQYLYLNQTASASTATPTWGVSATLITLQQSFNDYNTSTGPYVAYCWAEIAGFSKFGSYTGNASTDGPFVYTGFRPKFVLIKRADSTSNWYLFDTARDTYNVMKNELLPNSTNAEADNTRWIDILSNGFKIRNDAASQINASGATMIYMAFAENSFKNANAR